MRCGAVILAGGNSSRMGADKAALVYQGRSFLQRIVEELSFIDEILLSADEGRGFESLGLRIVGDIYPGCGPISGLHAALSACESDALFVTPCDMPLITRSLPEYLCSKLEDGFDAVVAQSADGRIHPLCAVYRTTAAAVFQRMILSGNYKIVDAFAKMKVCYVTISEAGISDEMMLNINTPDDYAALLGRGE